MGQNRVVFTSWPHRIVASILPVLLLLIGIENVPRSDARVEGAIALVLGAYFTFCTVRSFTFVVGDDGVLLRGARVHRITYDEVFRAAARRGRDHGEKPTSNLVLRLTNGYVVRTGGFLS